MKGDTTRVGMWVMERRRWGIRRRGGNGIRGTESTRRKIGRGDIEFGKGSKRDGVGEIKFEAA